MQNTKVKNGCHLLRVNSKARNRFKERELLCLQNKGQQFTQNPICLLQLLLIQSHLVNVKFIKGFVKLREIKRS